MRLWDYTPPRLDPEISQLGKCRQWWAFKGSFHKHCMICGSAGLVGISLSIDPSCPMPSRTLCSRKLTSRFFWKKTWTNCKWMVTLDPEAFQNAVVKLTDVYGAVVLAIHETIRNFAARREAINMQWAKTCTNSLCKHASLPPDNHRLLWQIVLWKCRATCCPQHLHSFILSVKSEDSKWNFSKGEGGRFRTREKCRFKTRAKGRSETRS